MHATRQLARAMSKPATVHQGAAKRYLRCRTGNSHHSRTSTTTATATNTKSTLCYVRMICRARGSFISGVQRLTAMSTMEADMVASALQSALCPLDTCDKRKPLTCHSHKMSPSRSSLAARKLLELPPYPATTMESFSANATPRTRSLASVPFCRGRSRARTSNHQHRRGASTIDTVGCLRWKIGVTVIVEYDRCG